MGSLHSIMEKIHYENNILKFLVHTSNTHLFGKVCELYEKIVICIDIVSPNIGCASALFYYYKMNNISLSKTLHIDLAKFYDCSPRTILKKLKKMCEILRS